MPRPIRLLVIHCSATPNDRSLFSGRYGTPGFRDPVTEIDGWHGEKKYLRESYWRGRQNPRLAHIGYHYVIARNGALFSGRHEDEIPAQAAGWNAQALGLCLVGMDAYTSQQWLQLKATVSALAGRLEIPLAPPRLRVVAGRGSILAPGVCGHRDLSPDVDDDGIVEPREWLKTCPGFSVPDWLAGGLAPLAGHVAEVGL